MRCRRLDAGLRLERSDFLHAQPGDEISERLVLDHDRHSLERRGLLFPIRDGATPALGERLVARLVVRGVFRIDFRQPRGERARDSRDVARIGLDMRVSAGVYVALGAIETHRLVEQRDKGSGLEVARLAGQHFRVAGLLRHQRQPTDLQLGAGSNDQIRAARPRDQARLRLDVVRVLQRVGRDVELDLVSAELRRERPPLRYGCEHVECRRGD